jgi:hypothetical protein
MPLCVVLLLMIVAVFVIGLPAVWIGLVLTYYLAPAALSLLCALPSLLREDLWSG